MVGGWKGERGKGRETNEIKRIKIATRVVDRSVTDTAPQLLTRRIAHATDEATSRKKEVVTTLRRFLPNLQ